MKRSEKVPIYLGLSIAMCLSVIALACNCPRIKNLGFDYMGIIVGVLSMLVTVLIGWQIFTALKIKEDVNAFMKDTNRKIDDIVVKIEKSKEESVQKIDELKAERGILKLSHSDIKIGKEKGKAYFTIDSNTNWNLYVNNTAKGQSINGLDVYPLNGSGNATITIEYDGIDTENYQQAASIAIFYVSYGVKQLETISIHRKHLPI